MIPNTAGVLTVIITYLQCAIHHSKPSGSFARVLQDYLYTMSIYNHLQDLQTLIPQQIHILVYF